MFDRASRQAGRPLELHARRCKLSTNVESSFKGGGRGFGLLVQEQCRSLVPAHIVLERRRSADIVPATLFPAKGRYINLSFPTFLLSSFLIPTSQSAADFLLFSVLACSRVGLLLSLSVRFYSCAFQLPSHAASFGSLARARCLLVASLPAVVAAAAVAVAVWRLRLAVVLLLAVVRPVAVLPLVVAMVVLRPLPFLLRRRMPSS